MAEVEDAEADVDSEVEVVASADPGMIAVEVAMVPAVGRGRATPGPETGSAKFLTAETQTSAGGTSATNARNPSQQVPAILQEEDSEEEAVEVVALIAEVGEEMTAEVEEVDTGAETTDVVAVAASEVDLEEVAVEAEMIEGEEVEGMEVVEMIEGEAEEVATEEAETLETAEVEVLAPVVP